MKQFYLSKLRDKHTNIEEFRKAANKLSYLLAAEVAQTVSLQETTIETPISSAVGFAPKKECVLVPILRAGLAMLHPFMEIFWEANIGFIGMRRNETTFNPEVYYQNIPSLTQQTQLLILDPMIATAGSSIEAIKRITQLNIPSSQICLVGIVAAKTGIEALKKEFPDISIFVAAIDKELNHQKFIVPGLGDFGDRYFGTC